MGHETPPHLLFSTIREKFSVTELTTDREDEPAEKASKSHKHRRVLSKTGSAGTLPSHCFCKRTELLRKTTGLRADLYGEFANSVLPASKSCLLVLFSRHSCRTIKAGYPSSRSFHTATSQAS